MIHSLEIKNIQAHEHTKLEFGEGVNVIVGSSNQGKSAILRSLYWVISNRPLGIDNLASHWAVNDKGYLIRGMSVKLVNDNGTVERRRTRDDNQYIVDGNVLNVVKTDVPSQVNDVLKLSETNVQKQLDAPFLLSKTNGEIAKYFNQMVNLDIIDKILGNAESTRRRLNSTIDSTTRDIEALERNAKEFTWIEGVETLLDEYDSLSEELSDVCSKIDYFNSSLLSYESEKEWKDYLDSLLSKVKGYLSDMDSMIDESSELDSRICHLNDGLDEVERFKPYDFTTQKRLIKKIEVVSSECVGDVYKLKDSVDDYCYYMNLLEMNKEKLVTYRSMLPKTCPLCGKPLEDDSCVSC